MACLIPTGRLPSSPNMQHNAPRAVEVVAARAGFAQAQASAASSLLASFGHEVEATDIPGLFRVDGGPELTTGQLVEAAFRAAGVGGLR